MTITSVALVVEDESSWSDVYERAVRRVGLDRVEVAGTYEDAAAAVDEMRFAVAVIDIGLSVDDDRNVDGLRVMEKIRVVGDPTSIIVVTGRSGRDVLPIIRDAIKKFGAYDTIAKHTLVPAELRALIEGGIREYQRALRDDTTRLHATLRSTTGQSWDDAMLRIAPVSGDVAEMHRLTEALLGDFVPLVPGRGGGIQLLDDVACGAFWSRGTGQPVVACLGAGKRIDEVIAAATESGLLLGRYPIGEIVGKHGAAIVKGAVFRITERGRSDFE